MHPNLMKFQTKPTEATKPAKADAQRVEKIAELPRKGVSLLAGFAMTATGQTRA